MARLNYHHLRYFWAVAHDGNLTRTSYEYAGGPTGTGNLAFFFTASPVDADSETAEGTP